MVEDGARVIDAGFAPRVRQMQAQHRATIATIRAQLEVLPDVAAELEEQGTESVRVNQLDQVVRETIDMLFETEARIHILNELESLIAGGDIDSSLADMYRERVQTAMQAYQAQTLRQRYAKNTAYIDFKSRVWEVKNQGAMPPLIDLLPAQPGDNFSEDAASDDDDIVMGGSVMQLRCPLTADILRDPVVNAACQHAYSRDAILSFMGDRRTRQGQIQCPAAGCSATVSRSTLQDAPALRRRVERYERHLLRVEEQRREQRHTTAVLN